MAGAADKLVVAILLFVSSKAPVLVVLAASFSSNVVPCAAYGTPCDGSNAVSLRSVLDFCCGLCWRGERPTSNVLVRWGGVGPINQKALVSKTLSQPKSIHNDINSNLKNPSKIINKPCMQYADYLKPFENSHRESTRIPSLDHPDFRRLISPHYCELANTNIYQACF